MCVYMFLWLWYMYLYMISLGLVTHVYYVFTEYHGDKKEYNTLVTMVWYMVCEASMPPSTPN